MIDSLINVFGKLNDIIKSKSDKRRLFFKDVVEPLFFEMNEIHKDYLATFEQISELILNTSNNIEDLNELLNDKKKIFYLIREKTYQLNYAITETEKGILKKQNSFIAFSKACIIYFRAGIDDCKVIVENDNPRYYFENQNERFSDILRRETYRGAYSNAIEFLSDEYLSFGDKRNLHSRILYLMSNLKIKWSDVTSSYAFAKIDTYK